MSTKFPWLKQTDILNVDFFMCGQNYSVDMLCKKKF